MWYIKYIYFRAYVYGKLLYGTSIVRNASAIRRVFHGLAGERSRLMNWTDPSPARSLSLGLVVGLVVGGDLVIN